MDWAEFSKALGGSAVGILTFLVFLNYAGQLLWKAQVEREIKALVDAKEKLDAVRLEQIEEERADKNEWKDLAQNGLKTIIDGLKENKALLDVLNGRSK